jgi:hypothetical protein
VAITTGGTGRLFVASDGKVGIGTSSPAGALDVAVGGTGPARILMSQSSDNPYIDIYRSTGVGSNFAGFRLSTPSTSGELAFSNALGATIGSHTFTERMRLTSTGQLRLAGAGITFNGDTAAANELDDYEEGTFTPTLQFGGASTGITYTLQSGLYTKIGRKVHVRVEILLSNKGSATGTAALTGLPFTASSSAFAATVNAAGNFVFTNGYLNGGVTGNSATITLYNTPTSGGVVILSESAFTNTTGMRVDAVYYV